MSGSAEFAKRAARIAAAITLVLGALLAWQFYLSPALKSASSEAPAPEAHAATAGLSEDAAPVQPSAHEPAAPAPVTDAFSLEEQWGIEVQSISLSAGGFMFDFRYRVVDPDKAVPLFKRSTKPVLVDEASGARFAVPAPPKVGALRASQAPEAGRIYFILFANPGRYVKAGSKVTLEIGECRIEHLTVE